MSFWKGALIIGGATAAVYWTFSTFDFIDVFSFFFIGGSLTVLTLLTVSLLNGRSAHG